MLYLPFKLRPYTTRNELGDESDKLYLPFKLRPYTTNYDRNHSKSLICVFLFSLSSSKRSSFSLSSLFKSAFSAIRAIA